jgi:hypothetical protein
MPRVGEVQSHGGGGDLYAQDVRNGVTMAGWWVISVNGVSRNDEFRSSVSVILCHSLSFSVMMVDAQTLRLPKRRSIR